MSYAVAKSRHYRKQETLRERRKEVRRMAYQRMLKPEIRKAAEQQLKGHQI